MASPIDLQAGYLPASTLSGRNAVAVTKSDTVALAYVTLGLWVGGTGDVSVIMANGATVVFTAVPAGSYLPIRITQVTAANTSATNLVAVW